MPTLKELLAQQEKLATQIEAIRAEQRTDGVKKIRQMMDELGISAQDLGFYTVDGLPHGRRGPRTFAPKAAKAALPAIYRDPDSGKTWSGRGKAPAWLGDNRDEFLIDKAA